MTCGHCKVEMDPADAIAFGQHSNWHCRECGPQCLVKFGWLPPVPTVIHDEENNIMTIDGQAFKFS